MGIVRGESIPRRRWGLGLHLLLFGLVLLLPALGLGAVSAWQAVRAYQGAFEARLRDTARALALALDSEIQTLEAGAKALASSPALRLASDDQVLALHEWASELGRSVGALRVIVNDAAPGHRQLLNTGVPVGALLPPPSQPGQGAWDLIRRVVETGQPVMSDLFTGRLFDAQVVAAAAPVFRDGRVERVVVFSTSPERFARLLAAQGLAGGAVAGLADGQGRLVARSRDYQHFIGTPAPPWYATVAASREGIFHGTNAEGEASLFGFRRLQAARDWGVVVGEPLGAYNASWQAPLLQLLFGAAVVLALAAFAAAFLAGRMLIPVRALQRQVDQTAAGVANNMSPGIYVPSTSVAEFEALRVGIAAADAALRAGEAQFQTAFEQAPIAMSQSDPSTGHLLRVNNAYCRLVDRPADAVIGRPFSDLVHPEDRDADLEGWHRMASGASPIHKIEQRYIRPDGSVRWAKASISPVCDPASGRVVRTLAALIDMSEHRAAEERQMLLTRELDHRAKNALAVVQAALRLTPKDDPHAFARAVEGRVTALARAHTLLAEARWVGADLRALAFGELAPFLNTTSNCGMGPSADLDGPPILLAPEATQPLSMALHELATNATKYGALSVPTGRVSLSWHAEAAIGMFWLRWFERGGPQVSGSPTRMGFGSRVLEATVSRQLSGHLTRSWEPAGFECTIQVPFARVVASVA